MNGKFLEVEASDISDATVDVAKQQKITQIIVGESLKEPCFYNPFKPAIPYQIFKRTHNIDVYIVATSPAEEDKSSPRSHFRLGHAITNQLKR